jgi:hypothetical protein
VSVEPVMLIKFAPASVARGSPTFTTKGLTCSNWRRGAGAGSGVEEPGVLPPRNGAGAALRSRGSDRQGMKQEAVSSPACMRAEAVSGGDANVRAEVVGGGGTDMRAGGWWRLQAGGQRRRWCVGRGSDRQVGGGSVGVRAEAMAGRWAAAAPVCGRRQRRAGGQRQARERCGLLLKSENFVPVSDRGGGYGG